MYKIKYQKFIILIILTLQFYSCKEEIVQPANNQIVAYSQIDFEPSVSNDNSKMVYVHSNLNIKLTGIYIYDFSTQSISFFLNGLNRCPDWSPDGKWIVYSLNNDLYKIKSNGDSISILTNFGKNLYPKWCNDGSKIAYANTDCSDTSTCGVYIVNTDGTVLSLIERYATYPEWSDSGSTLLFLKPIKNSNGQFSGDSLFKFSLNTKLKEYITTFTGNDHVLNSYLNLSGSNVIFCSTSETGYSSVYKYNLVNSSLEKLTLTQGYSPNASNFSYNTVYTNRNPSNGRIWMMNNNGSDFVQLTY